VAQGPVPDESGAGAHEGLRGGCLPRVRPLHPRAQRHLPQVRQLRRHHGLLVGRGLVPRRRRRSRMMTRPIPVTNEHLALCEGLRRPRLVDRPLALTRSFLLQNGERAVGLRLEAEEAEGPVWRVDLLEGEEPSWTGIPRVRRDTPVAALTSWGAFL